MMLTRPIRFTRFGTFYILFALAVGAAAINTGNNLLYLILGILLGFIVISGFLSDSALWGITTAWAPIGSLYAGEKALLECRMLKGGFPGVAISVESHWEGLKALYSFVPWIPSKGQASTRIELTPPKRGYLTLESCRYSTRFPFGLFQKSHNERMDERWVVYPHLYLLPNDDLERQGLEASPKSTHRQGMGTLPLMMRDYRAGDAMRQIQWKMSAKRQRLIVKEMEEEAGQGDLFYLDSWPAHFSPLEMESFISFIASLIFSVYERSRPFGLGIPERLFGPEHSRAHLHRIFEFLALVDPFQNRGQGHSKLPVEWNSRVIDIAPLWAARGRTYARPS